MFNAWPTALDERFPATHLAYDGSQIRIKFSKREPKRQHLTVAQMYANSTELSPQKC